MKLFQDIPNLAKLQFVWYTLLVKSFNEYYYFKITSRLWSHAPNKNTASDKNHFEDLPREKERCFIMLLVMLLIWSCFWFSHALFHLAMLLLTYSAPRTRILKSYNSFPTFWGQKWNLLFICHYSQLLFIVTIHLLLFINVYKSNSCIIQQKAIAVLFNKKHSCVIQQSLVVVGFFFFFSFFFLPATWPW